MTGTSWWAVTTENWSSENCSAKWSTALDSGGAILVRDRRQFRDGFRQLGGLVPELVEGACERHAWMGLPRESITEANAAPTHQEIQGCIGVSPRSAPVRFPRIP